MEDSHRVLEQKALRNVRGLLDRLERDSAGRRKREKWLILVAIAPLLLLVAISVSSPLKPVTSPMTAAQACEMDTWNAKASEFVRKVQESNPEMPYREVREQLKASRPALMAAARTECAARAR
jgi:hypothetical protein